MKQEATRAEYLSRLSTLQEAPLRAAVPIFGATSLLFFFALYFVLPILRNAGVSWFATYNWVLALPMLLLVCAAFVAYAREGRPFAWEFIKERFRLSSMDLSTWFWAAALAVFMFGGRYSMYLALALTIPASLLEQRGRPRALIQLLLGVVVFLLVSSLLWETEPVLRNIHFHSEPESLRAFLAQFSATSFMGIPLKGNWWVPFYYLTVLLIGNIAGEELWWRGYLLPRQELAHGRYAWAIHGALWAAFHLFFQTNAWELVRMFPTCCALAFVAQHKRNTWPGVIGHTCGNAGLLLQIVRGV